MFKNDLVSYTSDESIESVDLKYQSFFSIIFYISIFTFVLETIIFGLNYSMNSSIQHSLAAISFIILVITAIIALLFNNPISIHIKCIDAFVVQLFRNKAKGVTLLFFLFLLGTLIFIVQDGGARKSYIVNLFLLTSNLGFFFAKKKRIKLSAIMFFIIGYMLTSIVAFDKNSRIILVMPDWLAMLSVLFTISCNFIINASIKWNIERKTDNDKAAK